jgi:SAM-dependent methyltransferase
MENKTGIDLLKELNTVYKINTLDLATINLEISPEDTMFTQELHYYKVGFSALRCILQSLFAAQKDKDEIKNILDFPSGWGRVLRFIKAYFPNSNITACEIDKNSLKFCREQLKVNTLISHNNFKKIEIKQKFDLIWCGSLITHLSEDRSKELLEFFFNALNDKGILVFTAHGRYVRRLLES